MPPAFVHRITKYDPADRDEHGHYFGAEVAVSDHGPVEAAYLAAIAAFAEASGIDRLEIREPTVTGLVHFGAEPPVEGHGLSGLFPADLAGFHDGAEVPLPVALELVRVMLRDEGAWCRLEAGDIFTVHVGWDQYVYVGSAEPCPDAVARTRELGLFPEPMAASPYALELEGPEVMRAADEEFWEEVNAELSSRHSVLLEEAYVGNAARWHRLTPGTLGAVRAGLSPRALLTVWPELTPDDRYNAFGPLRVLHSDGRLASRQVFGSDTVARTMQGQQSVVGAEAAVSDLAIQARKERMQREAQLRLGLRHLDGVDRQREVLVVRCRPNGDALHEVIDVGHVRDAVRAR
ncbi:hypothetical protein [Streptomyces subrutilus]|uniref:hypothetical protein n=1 Tax=Streptomyces subrutilus TaxID=36818 RepID=UPI003402936A